MRQGRYIICTILALSFCLTPVFAHDHPDDPPLTISTWAQAEVTEAKNLGLVIEDRAYLPNDYRQSISRREFCNLAMQYVATQYHSSSIVGLYYDILTKQEGTPPKVVFSDGNRTENVAYYLGVVDGRGDGTFDPEGLITRQEAAVMLLRAYKACGGALPEAASMPNFRDQSHIANWASESITAMAFWEVLRGQPDGNFDPAGSYTVEQAIVSFLRLYNHAPMSRKNGTVAQRFSYEECLAYELNFSNYSTKILLEGKKATLVESTYSVGAPHTSVGWTVVYRDGGLASIDWGICVNSFQSPYVENLSFSEDGKTLFCTIPQSYQYNDYHPKGVYHITMDIDSRHYQIAYEAPIY